MVLMVFWEQGRDPTFGKVLLTLKLRKQFILSNLITYLSLRTLSQTLLLVLLMTNMFRASQTLQFKPTYSTTATAYLTSRLVSFIKRKRLTLPSTSSIFSRTVIITHGSLPTSRVSDSPQISMSNLSRSSNTSLKVKLLAKTLLMDTAHCQDLVLTTPPTLTTLSNSTSLAATTAPTLEFLSARSPNKF